jgi:hypothetical protein
LTDNPARADARVEIELSGIQYQRSVWVGRYYKVNYRIGLAHARDGRLLGSTDGAERATGDGWREVCADVAEDVAEEIADLIEDAQDD